jgi:uncharacterized membrane protein
MAQKAITGRTHDAVTFIDHLLLGLSRHWLLIINLILGLWVLLPWLAPALMATGLESGGRLIYKVYSTQCHQLPERSYFLFGPRLMYPLADINTVWPYTDHFRLRQFIGTPEMGYKVAWSDRMVALYTPLFIGGLLFALTRRRAEARGSGSATVWQPLPFRWFLVALGPMAVDGVTHMISDITNYNFGFRETNAWLAMLTGNIFAPTFYAGNAIGSFNWWMRLLTGLLAGFAIVWLIYPILEGGFTDMRRSQERKLRRVA